MLKDAENDYYKTLRPQLDETQIEGMERHISESLDNKTLTEITTWKNGFFNTGIGFAHKVDPL